MDMDTEHHQCPKAKVNNNQISPQDNKRHRQEKYRDLTVLRSIVDTQKAWLWFYCKWYVLTWFWYTERGKKREAEAGETRAEERWEQKRGGGGGSRKKRAKDVVGASVDSQSMVASQVLHLTLFTLETGHQHCFHRLFWFLVVPAHLTWPLSVAQRLT